MPDPVVSPRVDSELPTREYPVRCRRQASTSLSARALVLLCGLALVVGSSVAAARAQERAAAGAKTDWTLAVSEDAVFYVRWPSIGRFRGDIETFLTAVNPLASMMLGGMSAQFQSEPLYLALDLDEPVALASIAPDVDNRGGLVWIVPLDDAKLFRETFESGEFPDVTLHEHHGYAVLTTDPKQTPETIFAKRPFRTAGKSSMSGSIRLADLARTIDDALTRALSAIAEADAEADENETDNADPGAADPGEAEADPSGSDAGEAGAPNRRERTERSLVSLLPARSVERARAVVRAIGGELSQLAFDVDLGRSGMFVRATADPVEGSRFGRFLAAQKASSGAMRAVGDPSDMLRMYGRVDPRALLGDAANENSPEKEPADTFVAQLRSLADVLTGELAMSLAYDHATGFAGSQWLEVREGADAGAVLDRFAADPAWLAMVHSSAGARLRAEDPTTIEEVAVRDYRLEAGDDSGPGADAVAAMAAETIGGVLVGATSDRVLVTLGRSRTERMRGELAKSKSTDLPQPPSGAPGDAMFVVSLSLIDYAIATLSRIPGGPIPAESLKKMPLEGRARMTAFATATPQKLGLGIDLPMDTLQRFVNWGQQQMMAAMMSQRSRSRGGAPAAEGTGEPDGTPGSYVGHPLPNLELPDLSGNLVSLADQKGKVVILDFLATWAPPSVKQAPAFVELHEEYGDRGVVILGVSDEMKDDVAAFAKEHGIAYPLLRSGRDVRPEPLAAPYDGIVSFPTTFVIDRTGTVVAVHVGYRPKSVFVDAIEANL